MTSNEVAYWQLQETKRANLVNEGIKADTLAETRRSNLVQEALKSRSTDVQQQEADTRAKRAEYQNATDVVNSVTGGIKNVGSGVGSIIGLFK